jgi:hypothetical protein
MNSRLVQAATVILDNPPVLLSIVAGSYEESYSLSVPRWFSCRLKFARTIDCMRTFAFRHRFILGNITQRVKIKP